MRFRLLLQPALLLGCAILLFAPPAAARNADVAALQVGLHARGLYARSIDGLRGPATTAAIKRLQRGAGLTADGVPGVQTRLALGRYGRHLLGSRPLRSGASGWDVASLQFLLAWHGFPSGAIDGRLGARTERALLRFQRWAHVQVDGVAGGGTLAALRRAPAACPIALAWPVTGMLGDPFGPRGNRFHAGIDVRAPTGTDVTAAAAGRVTYAGRLGGGWGKLIVVSHARGVRTLYAHLSAVTVRVREQVAVGSLLGRVGATGDATGPHLHFEVRLRGAAVDPTTALP